MRTHKKVVKLQSLRVCTAFTSVLDVRNTYIYVFVCISSNTGKNLSIPFPPPFTSIQPSGFVPELNETSTP